MEFSLYHFFVILYVSTFMKALVGMIFIMTCGRILIYIKEKIGIIAGIIMHMGGDMAVITIMFLILYYMNKNKEITWDILTS